MLCTIAFSTNTRDLLKSANDNRFKMLLPVAALFFCGSFEWYKSKRYWFVDDKNGHPLAYIAFYVSKQFW